MNKHTQAASYDIGARTEEMHALEITGGVCGMAVAVVKVFIQDCRTAEFMRCDSMWTMDFNEAMDFLSVRRAVTFGMKELKDSFQIMRVESNALSGAVVIAVSNLSWPEGSQSSSSIALAHAPPKLAHAPEFMSHLPSWWCNTFTPAADRVWLR